MMKTLALTALAAATVYAAAPAQASNGNTGPDRWQGAVVTISGAPAETYKVWETDSLRIVPVESGADIRIVEGTLASHVGGVAKRDVDNGWIKGCTVTVRPGVDKGILVHEIGHCLGVKHMYGKQRRESIMNPWYEPKRITTVTPVDRKVIEALY